MSSRSHKAQTQPLCKTSHNKHPLLLSQLHAQCYIINNVIQLLIVKHLIMVHVHAWYNMKDVNFYMRQELY